MRISRRLVWMAIAAGVLASAGNVSAKGPADSITIQGPGLASPVAIADSHALEEFNPWADTFMDLTRGIASPPPNAGAAYQITIQVKPQWTYRFDYVPDASGGRGYIYLPGPGDERYKTNTGTIIRNQDGRWVYASQDWEALMSGVLKQAGAGQVTGAPKLAPTAGGGANLSALAALLLGGWVVVAGVLLLRMSRS